MPTYIVKHPDAEAEGGSKERLVEASDSRQARAFVAKGLITVDKASSADLFRLSKAGAELEDATKEPVDPPAPPAAVLPQPEADKPKDPPPEEPGKKTK